MLSASPALSGNVARSVQLVLLQIFYQSPPEFTALSAYNPNSISPRAWPSFTPATGDASSKEKKCGSN